MNNISWIKIVLMTLIIQISLFFGVTRYIAWDIFLKRKIKFWTKRRIILAILLVPFLDIFLKIASLTDFEILIFSLLTALGGGLQGVIVRVIRYRRVNKID